MEKGGSRVGWVAPPEVNRMTPSGLGLLLQALGPKERATPAAAAAKLVVAMAPCAPDLRSPKTDKGAAGVSVPTGQAVTWKGPLSAVSDPGVTTLVPPHAAVPGQCLCLELRFSMEENESGDLRSPAPFSVPVLLPLCSVPPGNPLCYRWELRKAADCLRAGRPWCDAPTPSLRAAGAGLHWSGRGTDGLQKLPTEARS